MIGHCSSHYDGQDNLSFEVQQENNVFWTQLSPKTLDVSNGADFCKTRGSSFDMASRTFDMASKTKKPKLFCKLAPFLCLHWVLSVALLFVCFLRVFCVVCTEVILCFFCSWFVLLLGCREIFSNLATRSRRFPVCTGFLTSLMQFLFSTGMINIMKSISLSWL